MAAAIGSPCQVTPGATGELPVWLCVPAFKSLGTISY
jgi:hypothetical protein